MSSLAHQLTTLAAQAIAQGRWAEASTCLDAALTIDPTCLPAHNLREAHQLPGCFEAWMGVKAHISEDDDIFRFFAGHPTSKNPVRDYLADGWRNLLELESLLDRHGRSLARCNAFLEFASGHGRLTRHLVQRLPAGALTVSDVVPGSVDFLRSHWAVKGFDSALKPDELTWPARYEVVFVLSLFTHLPGSVWAGWIRKLSQALLPGGLLIFSTHGQKCIDQAGVHCEDGYAFVQSSESQALDAQHYGTTFTTADKVRQLVGDAMGPEQGVDLVPSHFWGNQDAVILTA